MILTTHAIVGAAAASVLPSHPVLGFAVGFTSHFLLDAIPHWDYHLNSYEKDEGNPMNSNIILDKKFIIDLLKTGSDAFLGIIVAFILFGIPNLNLTSILSSVIFWGVVGGLAPDFLQLVYFKWKHEPVKSLQKFHFWIHTEHRLHDQPLLGIISQIIFITAVVAVSKIFF